MTYIVETLRKHELTVFKVKHHPWWANTVSLGGELRIAYLSVVGTPANNVLSGACEPLGVFN